MIPTSQIPVPRNPPGRARFYAVAAIFFLAALLRLFTWAQVRGTALDRWHLWDQSDMHSYLEQSRRLAAGDGLGRDPYHPYHRWQRFAPPEQWESWYPPAAFHQAPAYSYLLAAGRRLSPRYLAWIKLGQLLLGAVFAVLVFLLAERLAGRGAALAAGLITAFYGPLIYIELQILKEPLGLCLMLVALLFLLDALTRAVSVKSRLPFLARFFISGFVIGVLSMTHEMGRVVAVAAFAGTLLLLRGRRRWRVVALAALGLGWLVGMSPLIARNLAVGAPALSVSSRSVIVFAMSNDPAAPGGGAIWGKSSPALAALLDESGGEFTPLLGALWRAYDGDVGLMLKNWFSKVRALCAVYEAADNTSYAFYRSRVPHLRFLPGFWLIFAPGLAGAAIVAARLWTSIESSRSSGASSEDLDAHGRPAEQSATAGALLLMVFLALVGAMSLVHNIGRLRLFLVPPLAIFAGVFFMNALDRLRARPSSLVSSRGLPLWTALAAVGFQFYAEFAVAPGALRPTDFVVAANLERRFGDREQAIADYRAAIDLGRRDPEIYLSLGLLLWNTARPAEAIEAFNAGEKENIKRGGEFADIKRMLAWALATCPAPDLRDGRRALALALEADRLGRHEEPRALEALAAAHAELGQFDPAREHARRALDRAEALGNSLLADRIRSSLSDYQQGRATRDTIGQPDR